MVNLYWYDVRDGSYSISCKGRRHHVSHASKAPKAIFGSISLVMHGLEKWGMSVSSSSGTCLTRCGYWSLSAGLFIESAR